MKMLQVTKNLAVIKSNFCFIILFLVVFNSFKNEVNIEQKINIESWKKNSNNKTFIKFTDDGKAYFYDGYFVTKNYLIGQLFSNKNKVFFKSENFERLQFVLFNFELKLGQCSEIKYYKNRIEKTYSLCVEDIFYDNKRKDSIYKFYFKNYNLLNPKTGLIIFVGKRNGVLGNFLIDTSESDENPSIHNKTFGEIYENRYDYSKFKRFVIQ